MRANLPILSRMLAEMFGETTRARVARDPYASRKVTLCDPGKDGKRYWEMRNKRGQRVRFYRSTRRNIAGYFVIWRETTTKAGKIRNDHVRAFKTAKAARATNEARYKKALEAKKG
jgi:hypothetical protein